MRGKQFIALWELQFANQRVLELTDYGVGLVVQELGPEAHLSALGPDLQVKVEGLAVQAVVIDPYGICLLRDHRLAVRRPDLYLLALRSVVIKPPQPCAAGIIEPGGTVGHKRQAAVRIIYTEGNTVGNNGGLRKEEDLFNLPVTRA